MPDSIVNGNSQNAVTAKKVHTRSNFDLSYHFYNTMRFGEITPHLVLESVRGDRNLRVNCSHDVRSYSLKAPLMSKIQLKKDYFCVPMEAILPFNWDKVYNQPTIGDDVPSDAGTYVADFTSLLLNYFQSLDYSINTPLAGGSDFASFLQSCFKLLFTAECVVSDGSLASSLGIHLNSIYKFNIEESTTNFNVYGNIDVVVDAFMNWLLSHWDNWDLKYIYASDSNVPGGNRIWKKTDLRSFVSWYRDNLGASFNVSVGSDYAALTFDFDLFTTLQSLDFKHFGLDLSRFFAYQIVCAHYYSNDFVDYIYSAELYREYINSLKNEGTQTYSYQIFTYNGQKVQYDYLSARYFNNILTQSYYTSIVPVYLQAVFGYKRSLRFVDYFVGAKTRPLAVGDTNVAVGVNGVNVVDFARGKMATQFYNAVNRFGRKFSNYLEGLIPDAAKVSPDYHNPFFIGHTADDIYGQEIENTNVVDQESNKVGLSVVSNLRSNASRFAFEFDSDRPCIILGVSYFDIPRAYYTSIERQAFHKDRFDMFNPYMQFIGDQAVYERELFPLYNSSSNETWAYQLRHSEYKQRYHQASGGFVANLPGYAFLNDYGIIEGQSLPQLHLSPSYIRSTPNELDRFYVSLTGWSLASYFHFIVDTYNSVSASRPMAYAPSIL